MYPQGVTPRPILAKVVSAVDGSAITTGVTAYYTGADMLRVAVSGNAAAHLGGGVWVYTPTVTETSSPWFYIEFSHASAVGGGPLVVVYTVVVTSNGVPCVDVWSIQDQGIFPDMGILGMLAMGREYNLGVPVASVNQTAAQTIADYVWDEPTASHSTAGTFAVNLDAKVSTRLAATSYTAPLDATATQAASAAALSTYDPPTKAELDAAVSPLATSAGTPAATDWTAARAAKIDNLDVTVGSRLASASYTAAPDSEAIQAAASAAINAYDPPTKAELDSAAAALAPANTALSTAVWTDTKAGYLDAAVSSAGGFTADDRELLVSIAGDTTGLGAANITVTAPVLATGVVSIVRGDDYAHADGRRLQWTETSGAWPDLTGASIAFTATNRQTGTVELTTTGSVVTAGGDNQVVGVELEAADTESLSIGSAVSNYDVQATLANGHVVTLVTGVVTVIEDCTR